LDCSRGIGQGAGDADNIATRNPRWHSADELVAWLAMPGISTYDDRRGGEVDASPHSV